MKKYLLLKTLFLLGSLSLQGQDLTQTENYVYSRTYLEPVVSSSSTAKQVQQVNYLDGLGRSKQNISIKATPSGKDIVVPVEYDAWGRQIKDMLPLPQQATQNGGFFTSPDMTGAVSVYGAASNYYSEKRVENSPLQRLQEQAAPGDPWKMGSGKTIQYNYESNLSSEVRKFVVNTSWATVSGVAVGSPVLSISAENTDYASGGFYKAGTLYKNTITDEDGNKVTKFTNGKGQAVLVRKNDGAQNVDTYYAYNEYGQQAFVIPPLAVKAIETAGGNTIPAEVLDHLCYQYRYDNQDRLVEKKFPGKGWEFMVYDQQDRLVLIQDANLRTTANNFGAKGWIFTKYDQFNRIVYTGFFANTATRQVMQNALNSMTSQNIENRADQSPIVQNGENIYYTKSAFPTGSMTILSVNYYDSYPPGVNVPARPDTILGQNTLVPSPTEITVNGVTTSRSSNGLPTASYVRNIEDTGWTKDYFWYDTQGRPIGTHSINHLGGYTKTETELDFTGLAKQVKTYHKRLASDAEKIITETFNYDNQNRLLSHNHKVGNQDEEPLAINTYNSIGQLINKKVGLDDDGNPLQSVDYAYNIRGWLTGINDPMNLGQDLFAMKIKYQNPEDTDYGIAKYNGNISEVDWKTDYGDGIYRRYAYQYDQLNRLTDGIYLTPYLASSTHNHFYDEKMSYDINGNIKTLDRFSKAPSGVGPALQIDELKYDYDASGYSNKMIRATDNKANSSGYPAGGNLIAYDDNGNMLSMIDKGISSIQYNYLSLPRLTVASQGNTSYIYRADGTKVKKLFGTKATDYLDGFQYEDGVLKFFPTGEGFYNAERDEYVYQYKDLLGNIRFSYSKADGGGIMIQEESNYYPFGLKHEGYNSSSFLTEFGTNYRYKFLGQELQENGFYDLGARFYVPELGIFGQHDLLSGKTLDPYGYAYQNPIFFADPTGLEGEPIPGGSGPGGPQAIGTAASPIDVGEVMLTGVSKAKQMDNSLSYMGIHSLSSYQESKNRLNEAINNCRECKQLESVEKGLFIGIPVLLATGGIGGFAFSGEMTATAIGVRFLTDASVQTASNYTTNGGNLKEAIGNVNLTQSALAGAGMSYIGNAVVSTAVNINGTDNKSVFTGGVPLRTYVTQAGLSAVGGGVVQGITSSSVFKSIVVGSYMSTTASLGQTAGTAVANVLMNTPDYTRATLQNNVP